MVAEERAVMPAPRVTQDEAILADEALWRVVSSGDLKGLTDSQKTQFYHYKCRQLGVDPSQQPFAYMDQQGRKILYATKNLTDQLRAINGVTFHSIVFTDDGENFIYEGFARTRDGREDYDIGITHYGKLVGEAKTNARMKALTKFKRRVTLSVCGAGALDETEAESIPGAVLRSAGPMSAPAPVVTMQRAW